ncbi:hypothetical protein [Corynebacterium spheniscorum]|uniref:Uncharacterized protein n=1 Tax=Corynebacterium spheniscorum TaxID=185761 RepID=A0A1I2TWY2_9CORY|nr:hypothetical protein [Corynebacterium spheniscorum]KAA8721779.1 hypothetical protein F4V56_05505 [Corynebacterium spheniscorum]SFG69382.1 hypothetical protein SAMN05660282_01657 [Corynebacterium spheniscorum]
MRKSRDNELEELGRFEPGQLPSDNPNPDLRGPFKFGSRRLKEPKNSDLMGGVAISGAANGAGAAGAAGVGAMGSYPVGTDGVDASGMAVDPMAMQPGFDPAAAGFDQQALAQAGFVNQENFGAEGVDPQAAGAMPQSFDAQAAAAQGLDPQFLAPQGIDPNAFAAQNPAGFDPNMAGYDPSVAGYDPNMAAAMMNQNFDPSMSGFDPAMAAAAAQGINPDGVDPNAWDASNAETTSFEAPDPNLGEAPESSTETGAATIEEDSGLNETNVELPVDAAAEHNPPSETSNPEPLEDSSSPEIMPEEMNNPTAGMPIDAMLEGQDMSEQNTDQNNETTPAGMSDQAMADPNLMQANMPNAGMMQPNMQNPAMMQQVMAQPGMAQPGVTNPGMMQAGMVQPGMAQPGMAQPNMAQAGMMQPGMTGATGMPGEKKTQNIFGQLTEGLKRSIGNSEENQQAEPFLGGLATPGFNSLRVYIAIGLSLLMYGYAFYAVLYDDYVSLRWGVATWFCLAAFLVNAYTAYQVRQRHESQFVQGLGIAVTVIAAVIFILVLNSYMALETDEVLLERIRATQRDIEDSSTLKLKLK